MLILFGGTNLMKWSTFTSDYNLKVCSKRMKIKTLMLMIQISSRRRCTGRCFGGITSYCKIICKYFTEINGFYILSYYCCLVNITCANCVFCSRILWNARSVQRVSKFSPKVHIRQFLITTVSIYQIIRIQCRYSAHLWMVNLKDLDGSGHGLMGTWLWQVLRVTEDKNRMPQPT